MSTAKEIEIAVSGWMLHVACAAVVLAALGACGGDDGTTDAGVPPSDSALSDAPGRDAGAACASEPCPIPLDDLEDRIGDLWCDLLFTCLDPGFDSENNQFRNVLQSAERCAAHVQRLPYSSDGPASMRLTGFLTGGNADWSVIRGTVASGGAAYDPVAAAECLDALRGSCAAAEGPTPPEACRRAFTGTLPEGSTCGYSLMCAPGLSCQNTSGSGSCDQGTCLPLRATGEACDDGRDCTSGYCSSVCYSVTVSPPAREGERCGTTSSPATMERVVAVCATDLWCHENVCIRRRAPGEACERHAFGETTYFDVCVPDHACRGTGGSATCMPAEIGRAVGAPCGGWWSNQGCDPVLGLVCPTDRSPSTCVEVGDGTLGSPCDGEGPGDIGCDASIGLTCSIPGPAGGPLMPGFTGGTCEPRPAATEGPHC